MQIERVEISSLVTDPANARKHDRKNLEAIKGSLVKFQQQKPIVVNAQNIIIAGNGTYAAAKELGWTHIDIVRSELGKLDQVGFALADNRTSDLSEFDPHTLSASLSALQTEGFDLNSIGWSDDELAEILVTVGEAELPDLNMPESKDLTQMTFTIHVDQKQAIDEAISLVKAQEIDYPGNSNSNGNGLYMVCLQWLAAQKK